MATSFRTLFIRVLSLLFLVVRAVPLLHTQASPTASRAGDLQVGATFNLANSDYGNTQKLKGFGVYGIFDFKRHFGIDGEFRQLSDPNSKEGIYELTFEIGPRYVMHFGPLSRLTRSLWLGRVSSTSLP